MHAIAIQTHEGSHLTFVLIAGSDTLDSGATQRDCIITGPPVEVANMEHVHVKHRAPVLKSEVTTQLAIDIVDSASLEIQLDESGTGSWELRGAFGNATGLCVLAKPT